MDLLDLQRQIEARILAAPELRGLPIRLDSPGNLSEELEDWINAEQGLGITIGIPELKKGPHRYLFDCTFTVRIVEKYVVNQHPSGSTIPSLTMIPSILNLLLYDSTDKLRPWQPEGWNVVSFESQKVAGYVKELNFVGYEIQLKTGTRL